MKTKIYKNYGVLTHEKEVVYAISKAEIYDEIEVEIPEELNPYETEGGSICIEPQNSANHLLHEVLCARNGKPAAQWYDNDNEKHWKYLKEL